VSAADPRDARIAQLEADVAELKSLVRSLLTENAALKSENAALKSELSELKSRLDQNSSNSSQPPSSDPPSSPRRPSKPSGKKPGGQPGHQRNTRPLLPADQVDVLQPCKPHHCLQCHARLRGEDPLPLRHQVTELPVIRPHVTEYQLHALPCGQCGTVTRADLPPGVSTRAFGPNLTALVALCTVRFRQSKRLVQQLLQTWFHVELSLGSISNLESDMAEALAAPVADASAFVKEAAVCWLDETGWYQGKSEGRKELYWLWVMATPQVTVYRIADSRGDEGVEALLGADFTGVAHTDRWGAYNKLPFFLRQLCWAHLLRDFQGFVDRGGVGGRLGRKLLGQAEKMFEGWEQMKDGRLKRSAFQEQMGPVIEEVFRLLERAAVRAEPKTRGMARAILRYGGSLFTFVDEEGVEPTNNRAERAVRPGVILRKLSFGTESERGSRFVERMLTAVETLRQQNRDVREYLVAALEAHGRGAAPRSLLPSPA
jgi:transposase